MSTATIVYCKMQNRLGALDRVLAAFTHRGIIPGRISASHDEQESTLEIAVSFDASDDKMLDKLVKFLQKQVYVMETRTLSEEAVAAPPVQKIHNTRVIHDVHFERKVAHAHNA
jgi:acetolactate synthase small subunit